MIQQVRANLSALEILCLRRGVSRLELFGSASKGGFTPGKSDLDFMVEFKPNPATGRADAYFGLADDLEALFGCKVDLLERSAVTNPYLLRSIENAHETVYASA